MKALSVTQPWATLIAIGAKKVETRSWSTRYRGVLAIQASKSFPKPSRELCGEEPFYSVLQEYGKQHVQIPRSLKGYVEDPVLPLGMIVAVARITDIWRTEAVRVVEHPEHYAENGTTYLLITPQEEAFGDYGDRRFAWWLNDVRRLPVPIPCKGVLGLWEVPAAIYEAVASQLLLGEVRA